MYLRPILRVLLPCLLLSACSQSTPESNPVLGYLDKVEIQAEHPQIPHIVAALNDALSLSSDELVPKKYPDFQGNPDQWDLRTLLERHFVPDAQGKDLGDNFYADVKAPEVQARLRQLLDQLETPAAG